MIGLIQWVSFPNKNELVWCGFTPLFGGQEGNTKVSTEQLPLGVFNLVWKLVDLGGCWWELVFALLLRPTKYTHDSSYDHTSAKAHPPHHSQKSVNSSSASSRQSISVVHVNQQKALPREQHQPVAPLAGQDRIGQSLNHHNYISIYIYIYINKYIYNIYITFLQPYI